MSQYVGPKTDAAHLATQGDLGGGAPSMPRLRVYRSANLTLANNSEGNILFDAEDYDTASMHSTASNTDRLVIPEDGIYIVQCGVTFPGHATGYRRVRFFRSDAPASPPAGSMASPGAASAAYLGASWEGECVAGQYFWAGVTQTSGANMTIGGSTAPTWATLRRVA